MSSHPFRQPVIFGALVGLLAAVVGAPRGAGACEHNAELSSAFSAQAHTDPLPPSGPPASVDLASVFVRQNRITDDSGGCVQSKCSRPPYELRITFAPPNDDDTPAQDLGYRLEFADHDYQPIDMPANLTPESSEAAAASTYVLSPIASNSGAVVIALYDSLSGNVVRLTPVDRQGNRGPPSRWFGIP